MCHIPAKQGYACNSSGRAWLADKRMPAQITADKGRPHNSHVKLHMEGQVPTCTMHLMTWGKL